MRLPNAATDQIEAGVARDGANLARRSACTTARRCSVGGPGVGTGTTATAAWYVEFAGRDRERAAVKFVCDKIIRCRHGARAGTHWRYHLVYTVQGDPEIGRRVGLELDKEPVGGKGRPRKKETARRTRG